MSENFIRYVIGPILIVAISLFIAVLMPGMAVSFPVLAITVAAYLTYTYFTKTYKKK